jgi:hypothetical protein
LHKSKWQRSGHGNDGQTDRTPAQGLQARYFGVQQWRQRRLPETGARIDVASPIGLPESFVLLIETDQFSRSCHSVWSRDKQIGVAFD